MVRAKKLLQGLAVLALAGIFISLGNWQLDRARDLKADLARHDVLDQRLYNLSDLTTPDDSLPPAAFGKSIAITGHYIATYKAPNQIALNGDTQDWEVALAQVDTDTAILVVRGLWSDRLKSPEIVMATEVSTTGRIYPSQTSDRSSIGDGQLTRLDPSALTSLTDFQLYDGFIAASSESYRGGEIERARVVVDLPKSGTPGYYWQHISYVAIWWLMAGLVLWAPFYKRREEG